MQQVRNLAHKEVENNLDWLSVCLWDKLTKENIFDSTPFSVYVNDMECQYVVKSFDVVDKSFSHSFGIKRDVDYKVELENTLVCEMDLFEVITNKENKERIEEVLKGLVIEAFLDIQEDEEYDGDD